MLAQKDNLLELIILIITAFTVYIMEPSHGTADTVQTLSVPVHER